MSKRTEVSSESIIFHDVPAFRVTYLVAVPQAGGGAITTTDTTVYVDKCRYCEGERDRQSTFFPNHFASSRCESGGRNHCSCGTCF